MTPARRAGLAAFVVMLVALGTTAHAGAESRPAYPTALVFVVHGASLEELVAGLGDLGGGAALLAHAADVPSVIERTASDLRAAEDVDATRRVHMTVFDLGTPPAAGGRAAHLERAFAAVLARVGPLVDRDVPVQVYVASDGPAPGDAARGDTLGALVAAYLDPATQGDPSLHGTLTSDSTRREGVVVAEDLGYSIVVRGGLWSGLVAGGAEIRAVGAPPPFELHERYLQMRRLRVPVGAAAGLYVTLGGLFALGVVLAAWRVRISAVLGVVASGIALSVPVLAASLLAAGHLPRFSYATVVPFVVGVTLVVTAVALVVARRDPLDGAVLVAALVLLFLLVEAAVGWTAALTPLLGGSQLDGGRFYGMPNVETGLLLGASVWLAATLPQREGFVVLVAAGLFAGLPFAGADIGGTVTLFAAAGMWPAVRGGRPRWRDAAFAVAVVGAGVVAVLLANRFLATAPTHISGVGDQGVASLWGTFVHRLAIGWQLIERNPFAIVPVLGVPATLVALLHPPAAIAPSLERRPAWRAGLLTIVLASVVAYVANDTGAAAVGLGFGMALGGLLYVSSADRTWKMDPA